MSDILVTFDTPVLRSVRLGKYCRVGYPRRRTARLTQQIIMTMQAYLVRYMLQNLLSNSLGIIFRAKVMLVGILGPCISLRRNMCKVLVFRWKMAIDALNSNTSRIVAMRR